MELLLSIVECSLFICVVMFFCCYWFIGIWLIRLLSGDDDLDGCYIFVVIKIVVISKDVVLV